MLQDVIDALRRKTPNALALASAEAAASPQSSDAQHLLGLAQRDAGDRAGARASFERAIELAPDESLYHFSRAMLAYVEGDHATANRSSAHAIALDPNQLGAYLLRIRLALAADDLAEAERQLNLAERVDSAHPQLLFAGGQVALAKGDGGLAIELLNKAAIARPADPEIFSSLGTAFLRFGHPAFAEQALRKAMTLAPDAPGLRLLLVESLLGQDRIDDAEAELASHRVAHPRDPAIPMIDAELRLRGGDPVAALAAFRSVLALTPGNPRAVTGAHRALTALGDYTLARAVWEEVLQRDASLDLVWAARLLLTEGKDDYDDVLLRWRTAMPDSAAMFLNHARQDEFDGRHEQAEVGYAAVLARAPLQSDALFGKAMYEVDSDPTSAIARLGLMIAKAPSGQAKAAMAKRGQVHDRHNHCGEAVADWRQAHAGLGRLPIMLPLPTDALRALAMLPLPAATGDNPVVMLWGPPGSGSERLAFALRFSPSRPLLQDAQEPRPRMLQFPEQIIARALSAAELPAFASEIADEYRRTIAPYLERGNQGVFDWLAQWDARIVPSLRHALPQVCLIAVLRDPRDLLLNWLAFGAPAGQAFVEPVASADWLASQLDHLLFSRDVLQLPVLVVDMDRLDADPAVTMQSIAAFADLPAAPNPQPVLGRATGPGRLPTLLPPGRWRAYREQFEEAFAVLAPLAERLGYPRE
jgi:Flp pilus assembly protein TadD